MASGTILKATMKSVKIKNSSEVIHLTNSELDRVLGRLQEKGFYTLNRLGFTFFKDSIAYVRPMDKFHGERIYVRREVPGLVYFRPFLKLSDGTLYMIEEDEDLYTKVPLSKRPEYLDSAISEDEYFKVRDFIEKDEAMLTNKQKEDQKLLEK